MATIASYQWLCLRTLKPRRATPCLTPKRQTSTSTEPTQAEPSSPSPPLPSHETITPFLHAANDQKLRETQSHLSSLEQSISTTKSAILSTLHTASAINTLIPSIPTYTPTRPAKTLSALPAVFSRLDTHLQRLHANLTDLLSIPYPDSSPADPTKSEKFLEDTTTTLSHAGQKDLLQTLRYQQISHETRMKLALEKLKEEVRWFEGLKGRRKGAGADGNTFLRERKAGVGKGQVVEKKEVRIGAPVGKAVVEGKRKEGWGTRGTTKVKAVVGQTNGVPRTSNPFVERQGKGGEGAFD